MPVVRSGEGMPVWAELKDFEILRLEVGQQHRFGRSGAKEKLICAAGSCSLSMGGEERTVEEGANLDLTDESGIFEVLSVERPLTLVRMWGDWGDELGGSGLFSGENSAAPQDKGDPVEYPKYTNFDAHYHDCDEYWIVYAGRASVVSEGRSYQVGPGDCVVTGMGDHHDVSHVDEKLHAVFFETTMEGAKRRGHLWNHTHGPARPRRGRS